MNNHLKCDLWPDPQIIKISNQSIIRVFLWHAKYDYNKRDGVIIRLMGNVEHTNESILINCLNYYPHFYIWLPEKWRSNANILIPQIIAQISTEIRRSKDKYLEILGDMPYIRDWDEIEGIELIDYNGKEKDTFYDIQVEHPRLVKTIKDLLKDPTSWCIDDDLTKVIKTINLFEVDSDFLMRFVTDAHNPASSWYEIDMTKVSKYDYIDNRIRLNMFGVFNSRGAIWISTKEDRVPQLLDVKGSGWWYNIIKFSYRQSYCHHEITISTDELKSVETENISLPNIKIVSFDGEMNNNHGRRFPNPLYDPVLQLSVICTQHDSVTMLRYIFVLDKTEAPENCDILFAFEYEEDLIRAFYHFILVNDVDVIAGHNSGGFDLTFIRDRIKALKLKLPNLGRYTRNSLYIQQNTNKGLSKYNAFIPGRLHVDTMRWEQEAPGARDMSLNALAEKYLKKETKYDMDMNIMSLLQTTEYGRKRLARYCIMDSVLVWMLVSTIYIIGSVMSASSLFNVFSQTLLNRSQGAKLEGYLMGVRFEKNKLPILKIDRQNRKQRKDKWGPVMNVSPEYKGKKQYEGAIVIDPVPGLYKTMTILPDFAGLYPSIIMAWNICFSTFVHNYIIKKFKLKEGVDYFRTFDTKVNEATGEVIYIHNDLFPAFLLPEKRKGLMPKLQRQLKARRKKVKYLCFIAVKSLEYIKAYFQHEIMYADTPFGLIELDNVFDKIMTLFNDCNKSKADLDNYISSINEEWINFGGNNELLGDETDKYKRMRLQLQHMHKDEDYSFKLKFIAHDLRRDALISFIKDTKAAWDASEKNDESKLNEKLKAFPEYYENEIRHTNFDAEQLIIKFTMNSIYGITGDENSGYFMPELAATITRLGRYLINLTRTYIPMVWNRKNGCDTDTRIIGGDTGTVYIFFFLFSFFF